MEDRVAEVLAQRAELDNGAAGGLVLSILLHGGITALAVYAALHHRPTTPVNILTISLAPITQGAAAPAAPKPVAPKLQEPQPVIEQPKPAEPVKPVEKTVPLSPFGKSTKKGSETPPPPPPAAAATSTAPPGMATGTTTDVPVGGAGVVGLEGGEGLSAYYVEKMRDLIGTHWVRPNAAPGVATIIHFVVKRDGSIHDAEVTTPSGNGTFDRNALRAVLETSPLPPLPFAYNGTYLGVHLTFK